MIFFRVVNLFGYQFLFNSSVIFFCMGFFIIDLVTEIYNERYANYFIFSKLLSQIVFIGLGIVGITVSKVENGQMANIFFLAPKILASSMIASVIGYKLTGRIMQFLKLKFKGRSLYTRYLSSTFPGEIVFSLVFTLLSFSFGKNFFQVGNIFLDLVAVKFVFSALISIFIVPVTNLIKNYLRVESFEEIKSIPFGID